MEPAAAALISTTVAPATGLADAVPDVLVSVSDEVAIALVSAGAALAGGLIGGGISHFTTIRSHKLRVDEDHFRHRQGVYHDFLDSVHWFMQFAPAIPKPQSVDRWGQWFLDFEHCLTAVHLFGSAQARDAAQKVADLIGEVLELTGEMNRGNIHAKRAAAYEAKEDGIHRAWRAAIKAMRDDVGPDA